MKSTLLGEIDIQYTITKLIGKKHQYFEIFQILRNWYTQQLVSLGRVPKEL